MELNLKKRGFRCLHLLVFFNRAAMGRARFLLCTGFISRRSSIFNRAAMGRARFLLYTGFIYLFFLTARPWAERGSCFTRDLLLTARPWAERGSCSARDLIFFVFLSVTRPKPPLGQITIGTESRNLGCSLAKSCWNNDVREMLRIMFSFL